MFQGPALSVRLTLMQEQSPLIQSTPASLMTRTEAGTKTKTEKTKDRKGQRFLLES